MKNAMLFFCFIVILIFLGTKESVGQWAVNGTHIYNTNSGNVGIGNSAPAKLFYVGKNMTEPTIAVRNFGGLGGATYEMIDDASGADWKFKATNTGGFKIRDNVIGTDVLAMDAGIVANAIYFKAPFGDIGVKTTVPEANLHVAETWLTHTAAFGQCFTGYTNGTNVTIGDNNADAVFYIGQDASHKGFMIWEYNATLGSAIFKVGAYNGSNPLALQPSGGNVGIGTVSPIAKLDVRRDGSDYCLLGYTQQYPSYFHHSEEAADGDNQAAIYAFRTRTATSEGVNYWDCNSAIRAYNLWGDVYTFGISGFCDVDYNRSGAIMGYSLAGPVLGVLAYRNSGATLYGGYFSSTGTGNGKSSQSALTGVGLGSWGELFGADIHGEVYGLYAEGGSYAVYSHGNSFKDGLDVHLQVNEKGANTVMYTNVSTEVTIQTSGIATLSSGRANISFDPAFSSVLSENEPVIITVTPIGESNGVYLSEVTSEGFSVVENNAGKSNVTVNYIAIGKRVGYEKPQLAREVIDAGYTGKIRAGLHDDSDMQTNGGGLYYENGQLVVGIHPSTLPDISKQEPVLTPPSPMAPEMGTGERDPASGEYREDRK